MATAITGNTSDQQIGNSNLQTTLAITDIEIPRLEIENLKWNTPQETQNSIIKLYQYAEKNAQDSINWYGQRKGRVAWKSRILRFFAIILTSIGGLIPILGSTGLWDLFFSPNPSRPQISLIIGQFGYLFLGLAAACIGLDRFFGFSSAWMRYLSTKMIIERALSEFRIDWAMMVAKLAEKPPTPDQVQLMLQRIKDFVVGIDKYVEQETEEWITEFRTNLIEIEKSAKTLGEAARPGAIAVTVTNGMDTDNGFTVALDGVEVRTVNGTKYQIGYVPPGPHKIAISGEIKGEQLDASELVNVAAGAITNVTLALPVKEAQP